MPKGKPPCFGFPTLTHTSYFEKDTFDCRIALVSGSFLEAVPEIESLPLSSQAACSHEGPDCARAIADGDLKPFPDVINTLDVLVLL